MEGQLVTLYKLEFANGKVRVYSEEFTEKKKSFTNGHRRILKEDIGDVVGCDKNRMYTVKMDDSVILYFLKKIKEEKTEALNLLRMQIGSIEKSIQKIEKIEAAPTYEKFSGVGPHTMF